MRQLPSVAMFLATMLAPILAQARQDLPPEAIDDLAAAPLDDETISISWTAPYEFAPNPATIEPFVIGGGSGGSGGPVASYEIGLSTTPPQAGIKDWFNQAEFRIPGPGPLAPGEAQIQVMDQLVPETAYYIAVKATNSLGLSNYSNVASATTPADPERPAAVADLRISGVGETSVTLEWEATGDDGLLGGAAEGYEIRYLTGGDPVIEPAWAGATPVAIPVSPKSPGQTESFTVQDLAPGLTYRFAIKVRDEVGPGAISAGSPAASTPIDTDGGSGGGSGGWGCSGSGPAASAALLPASIALFLMALIPIRR